MLRWGTLWSLPKKIRPPTEMKSCALETCLTSSPFSVVYPHRMTWEIFYKSAVHRWQSNWIEWLTILSSPVSLMRCTGTAKCLSLQSPHRVATSKEKICSWSGASGEVRKYRRSLWMLKSPTSTGSLTMRKRSQISLRSWCIKVMKCTIPSSFALW